MDMVALLFAGGDYDQRLLHVDPAPARRGPFIASAAGEEHELDVRAKRITYDLGCLPDEAGFFQ